MSPPGYRVPVVGLRVVRERTTCLAARLASAPDEVKALNEALNALRGGS